MTWVRRVVPMLVGAGALYLAWRLAGANSAPVDVDFLAGRIDGLVLWKALAAAFVSGALVVGLFTAVQMARSGLVARRYRKRLAGLETEIHQLRNLPLAPEENERAERRADGAQGAGGG